MPKKTKKEKLLASYHRKIRLLENRQMITSPVPTKIPSAASTPIIASHEIKHVVTEPVNQYFFSDLKKSLLLIILIVGVEVSLYAVKLIK